MKQRRSRRCCVFLLREALLYELILAKRIFFRLAASENLGIAPLCLRPSFLPDSKIFCFAREFIAAAPPLGSQRILSNVPPFTPSTPVKIVLPLSLILFFGAGNQESMPNIMKNICFWKKL